MRNQFNNSHYYENATTEVEDQFASYASASGFDESFFKTVVDLNDVELKTNTSLTVLYGTDSNSVDTNDFEQILYGKLIENIKSRKIGITADAQKAIHLLAKTCADTYTQTISIPYAKQLAPMLKVMKRPILYAELFLAVFIVLFAVLIYFFSRWQHRAIRTYIYSVSGTMLMLIVLPTAFLLSGKINKIALISKSLYDFSVCYLTGFAYLFYQVTLLLAIVLAVLIILYRSMLKQAG
jgi:hypothetical protein